MLQRHNESVGIRRFHHQRAAASTKTFLLSNLNPTNLLEEIIMSIFKQFDRVVQYFSGAFVRIFGPSDDSYPATGSQAFSGTSSKKPKKHRSFD